eukprot:g3106.t1
MFQVFRRFLSDAFRCKKYGKAYEWFRELQHLSDQCEASGSSRSLLLDDETYEMGVVAASKALRPKRAFFLLKEMIEEGRTPVSQTFERVASSIWHDANVYQQNRKHWNHPSTRRRRQQRHTEVLHLMMEHADTIPSKTFYHRCLKSHVRAKKWKVASDLFDRYERARAGVSSAETCDTKAYKLAITASTRMEDAARSLRLFHALKRSRAPPSEHTCMELLVVCLHAKRWKDAIGVVSYMKSRSMDVKSAVYATVSETCARAEQWHVAMVLLKRMQLDGIEPCEMSELTLGRSLSASPYAKAERSQPLLRWCINGGDEGNARKVTEKEDVLIDINTEDEAKEDTWCSADLEQLRSKMRDFDDVRSETGSAITFWGGDVSNAAFDVETRLDLSIGLLRSHAAPAQLLHYPTSADPRKFYGGYRRHLDCGGTFAGAVSKENERIFSVLIYLNDVDVGGETVFTELRGVSVKPRRGRALIWKSLRDDAMTCRNDTRHFAAPAVSAPKFAYQRWYHVRPNRYDSFFERFENLRRVANLSADRTAVCESYEKDERSCREYVTLIPSLMHPSFRGEMRLLERMIDRFSARVGSRKGASRNRALWISALKASESDPSSTTCEASAILVNDAHRLVRRNKAIVRALRQRPAGRVVIEGQTRLGAFVVFVAALTHGRRHAVIYDAMDDCALASRTERIWSEAGFLEHHDNLRARCNHVDAASHQEQPKGGALLFRMDMCETIDAARTRVIEQIEHYGVVVSFHDLRDADETLLRLVSASNVSMSMRNFSVSDEDDDGICEATQGGVQEGDQTRGLMSLFMYEAAI